MVAWLWPVLSAGWESSCIRSGRSTPLRGRKATLRSLCFFQAEAGIRHATVTGVQTCALPIFGRGHVEERLVERDGLHEGCAFGEERHDRIGRFRVTHGVAGDEDAVRAEPAGGAQGHRRANAEPARLVRGRAHHAAVVRTTADDHGLAAVFGMVALLDRRVEGVEVTVEDRAAVTHMTRAPCALVSGARKRASCSASASADDRSARPSVPNGCRRTTASFFVAASAQVPAAKPSTRKTASMIAFFA